MSTIIKTVDLSDNSVITSRNITMYVSAKSMDVNQVDGTYAVVEPQDSSGGYNGRVMVYPQSLQPEVAITTEFKSFVKFGTLLYPLDAKFDYVRGKLWIADTGNDRVLKVDLRLKKADLSITSGFVYPHSLAVNLNNGGIFLKGYLSYNLEKGVVIYYRPDGVETVRFVFDGSDLFSSSSSSSYSGVESSSSSSGPVTFPVFPSFLSMVFDSMRSRLWWVDGVKCYMADIGSQQVSSYDLRGNGIDSTLSVAVDLKSGNALVVAENNHGNRVLVQMFRDNNAVLGTAYIEA